MLEAVLNGAHGSYANFAVLRTPQQGRSEPSLVVNYDADCGEAAIARRGGGCCIRHAHYRLLPRRVAFVGTCAGSMKAITPAAALWGLMGLAGVAYVVIVARRIRTQSVYEPDFEDWLFHLLMPLAAYALVALSALAASSHADEALFGVGAATLLLLFIGIHNAWDAVAYRVLVNKPDRKT